MENIVNLQRYENLQATSKIFWIHCACKAVDFCGCTIYLAQPLPLCHLVCFLNSICLFTIGYICDWWCSLVHKKHLFLLCSILSSKHSSIFFANSVKTLEEKKYVKLKFAKFYFQSLHWFDSLKSQDSEELRVTNNISKSKQTIFEYNTDS